MIQKYIFSVTLGENENYSRQVFLIYDGIHYDPLGVINSDGTPVQTVFNSEDDAWISAARQVGDKAREVIKKICNTPRSNARCVSVTKVLSCCAKNFKIICITFGFFTRFPFY